MWHTRRMRNLLALKLVLTALHALYEQSAVAEEHDTALAQVTLKLCVCDMKLDVPSRLVYVVINTVTHRLTHTDIVVHT